MAAPPLATARGRRPATCRSRRSRPPRRRRRRRLHDGLARAGVGRVEGFRRAQLQRRLAFALVDVGGENRLVGKRAGELQPHHADAAEADDQQRPELQVGHRLLDGAVAGEAGAHERAGDARRDALHVEQVARMRHQHMRGIAAVDGDAERAWARCTCARRRARTARICRSRSRDRRRRACPGSRLCASGPAASTVPAISWPSVKGIGRLPRTSSFWPPPRSK